MGRQVAFVAVLGAVGGALAGSVAAVVAFLTPSSGTDEYFRLSGWLDTRREVRSA